ncbi:MAG: DUF58 domain-containing protein [Steroidobacteraceae bacterium]
MAINPATAWRKRLAAAFAGWVRRRQGKDRLPLQITARRLYILPTRTGMAFALLLFVMLLASLNYSNNVALFATFLFGGVWLVAMHQCHRNLLGLSVVAVGAKSGFAASQGEISIHLHNHSAADRHALVLDAGRGNTAASSLLAGETLSVAVPFWYGERGRQTIPRVRLETRYPYGLFRAFTYLHGDVTYIAWPKPIEHGAARGTSQAAGAVTGGQRPGADDFSHLRDFREGDSPRRVAWSAYARGAPLMVKSYVAEQAQATLFDFDALAPMPAELRLQQICRWIVDAHTIGASYQLRIGAKIDPPGRGLNHYQISLDRLGIWPENLP